MLWLHPDKVLYTFLCIKLYVNIWTIVSKLGPNLLCNLFFMKTSIEKVHLFFTDPRTNTITIFANFKNSLSHLVNKVLLLIVTHILITRFLSQC